MRGVAHRSCSSSLRAHARCHWYSPTQLKLSEMVSRRQKSVASPLGIVSAAHACNVAGRYCAVIGPYLSRRAGDACMPT